MNYSKLKLDIDRAPISIRKLCAKLDINAAGLHRSLNKGNMYLNVFEGVCKELKLDPLDYMDMPHIRHIAKKMDLSQKLEVIQTMVADAQEEYKKSKKPDSDI